MSRAPRRWYRGSEATRISIEERTCPRCGRRGALGVRMVGDRPQWFCKWARMNKCNTAPIGALVTDVGKRSALP